MNILLKMTHLILSAMYAVVVVVEWTWRPIWALVLGATFWYMMTRGYNTIGVSLGELMFMIISCLCVGKGAVNQIVRFYKNTLKSKFSAKVKESL